MEQNEIKMDGESKSWKENFSVHKNLIIRFFAGVICFSSVKEIGNQGSKIWMLVLLLFLVLLILDLFNMMKYMKKLVLYLIFCIISVFAVKCSSKTKDIDISCFQGTWKEKMDNLKVEIVEDSLFIYESNSEIFVDQFRIIQLDGSSIQLRDGNWSQDFLVVVSDDCSYVNFYSDEFEIILNREGK